MSGLQRLFDHANRGFPRPLLSSRSTLEQLRELDFQEVYRGASWSKRFVLAILRSLLYPFTALIGIGSALRQLPRFGIPVPWTELFPMYAAAMLRNIPPVEYVLFGFAHPERRRRSGAYLYWMDQPALQWLNRCRGADNQDVQDKARFARLCLEAGLPHAGTLLEPGQSFSPMDFPFPSPNGTALWVKPVTGSGGKGCALWHVEGDGSLRSGGERLSREQWGARLSASNCLVQAALSNHPGLKPVTNGAAVVIRLVTVLERSGACTLIGSSVALPQGAADSTVGALGCVPDLETGRIAKVSLAGSDALTAHPDTGTVLPGFPLPCWKESRDLVMRAHREAFATFASLGWDVVVTPGGPVLLETNSGWGTMGQQMDFGPLSETPLARIAADELGRAA